MNWLLPLYFPLACIGVGWAGWWALRPRPDRRSPSLAVCRTVLLLFPALLLAASLQKPVGPAFWLYLAHPLADHGLVLAAYVGLVGARWIGEMIARQAFQRRAHGPDLERRAPGDFLAAIGYGRLAAALAPPWWRSWLPAPALYLSKITTAGHLTSGLRPRICLDASLVPGRFRTQDLWWHPVLPAPGLVEHSLEPLRAVVAHELAHFQRADHLRTLLVIFTGALLPWEWLFGAASLGKFQLTDTWLFRQWSRLMDRAGTPIRRGLLAEKRVREALADAATAAVVPDGARHLRALRGLYPSPPAGDGDAARPVPPAPLRRWGFCALAGALLWACPGRIPCLATFGTNNLSTPLPGGWCLTVDGTSMASAVYIPGRTEPGRMLVYCRRVDPSQPPQVRAIGRQRPESIPAPCAIEMTWEVHYTGKGPLTGGEAHMSVRQSSTIARGRGELLAVHALPAPPGQDPGPGWTRRRLVARIQEDQPIDVLFIGYTFPAAGRYIFRPPVLTLVLPGGERRPYPVS